MLTASNDFPAHLGAPGDPKSGTRSHANARTFALAALGIVLLTIVSRAPAFFYPQAIDDEAIYSVVANAIVDGGHPYIDAVERKPPLLFWTYAAVFEVAGEYDWKALHAFALLWTLGTMAGLYVIGKRLLNPATGLIAAFFYSVFQCWATGKNLAFNGELMMNLPLVWAWAIAFGKGSARFRPELFAAGALLCIAFLLKQPAAIAAVPIGIYLLLPDYRANRHLNRSDSMIHFGMLAGGFLAALGLVAVVLRHQNILGEAFYWTITNHTVAHVFWESAGLHTLAFIGCCMPLLIGAAMALRNRGDIWMNKRAERTALLLLLIVSVVGVAAGGRFYPHYYIQLIPPLALLAAPHYARLWSRKNQSSHWLLRPQVTYLWLAATVVAFTISHWLFFVPERGRSETDKYLLKHSTPDDRIFVWGRQPEIYLRAERRPACRYVSTFPLTGAVFGGPLPNLDTHSRIVPGAWANLEQDFAKHPPMFIVDCSSQPGAQYPIREFSILANLVANKYRPVRRTIDAIIYKLR